MKNMEFKRKLPVPKEIKEQYPLTPELANRLGHETALRFTGGDFPFIVATHTDKAHIHNHVIFSAISTDCDKRFHDFHRSGLALQKVSDMICLENGLSVIEPKPKSERTRRTEWPKKPKLRDEICADIDAAMHKNPKDMDALLRLLMEFGYEVKQQKHIALRKSTKLCQRLSQRLRLHGLKQIIDAIHFESIDSILIVSRSEYNRHIDLHQFEDIKRRAIREMNIHKYQIGMLVRL